MIPKDKLESICRKHNELEDLLCQPNVIDDTTRFVKLSKELSQLTPLVELFNHYSELERKIVEDREALTDPELRELVLLELPVFERELVLLEKELELLLLPTDKNDDRNTILEIRSAAGGDEAALFAADMFRMYERYAERIGWNVEVLSCSPIEKGGMREIVALISGKHVYSTLRFESGTHRVQRIPTTESKGRIHTSTITVAILPEAKEVDVIIRDEDLEFTATGSGGPGGQHANTTNSAVIITHKPSGIMVRCQEERSQHKNKARALQILRAKLMKIATETQSSEIATNRLEMVGAGKRSEKIRTYNFPQNRVTDHRIGLTIHKLDNVLTGDLDELLTALKNDNQATLLAEQDQR